MSLGVRILKLEIGEAKNSIDNYEHNLVREISSVQLDKPKDEIIWGELEEAFFFNDHSALHFFKQQNELAAVEAREKDEDVPVVEKCYKIDPAAKKKGEIIVKEYLDFDEDGQCFVGYVRLAGIREKGDE